MATTKRDQDEAQQAFLPKGDEDAAALPEKASHRAKSSCERYGRLALEIIMACMIVGLLVRLVLDRKLVKPSLGLSFPQKTYTFTENPRYLHEDMFASREETLHTLHNWIELSADGRGYVRVDDSESLGLSPPFNIGVESSPKPAYMMSVFHQLHCLSYVVQHYQTGFDGVNLTQEVAHHSAHCFDYLRQSIMCAADTSLEGETGGPPGWGSEHQCKDYDAVLAWANERTVVPFRGNLPGEAVL